MARRNKISEKLLEVRDKNDMCSCGRYKNKKAGSNSKTGYVDGAKSV